MAHVDGCLLRKAEKHTCQDQCRLAEEGANPCVLANLTDEEAKSLVVPPMGGPKFTAILIRVLKQDFQNAADDMAALERLIELYPKG